MPKPETLSIIIPALNEEDGIGTTIQRCLDARNSIQEKTGLRSIEIIVVNDGSTDKTSEIAGSFSDVKLINLKTNQGYGAAIKKGFQCSTGDLLAFLDGDGTCEPNFFAELCRTLIDTSADIVTGSRMHRNSKMPTVRKIGNYFYARLMSFLTGCKINDTASGMRVLRKEVLKKLHPLPDGLQFTPAMSCRALLNNSITLKEIEMPYHERQGISKLCIFKDGLRFFLAITDITLTYYPLKFFGRSGSFLIFIAILYGITPSYSFFAHQTLGDGSIYRLITVNTLIIAGLTLFSVGIVAERVAASLNGNMRNYSWLEKFLLSTFSSKKLIIAGPLFILFGILLNIGPIQDYLTTLQISYHWGYISTGALLVLSGLQLCALGIFERLLETAINSQSGKTSST